MTLSYPNFPNLATCDKAHHILSVKNGVLLKLPNVDLCGKPELKLKDLASIHQEMTMSSEKSTDADVAGNEMTLTELRIRCQKQKPFAEEVDLDEPLIVFKKRKSTNPDSARKRKRNKNQQNLEREKEQASICALNSEDNSLSSQAIEVKEETKDADVLDPSSIIDDALTCSINEIFTINHLESSSHDEMESSFYDDVRSRGEICMVEKSTSDSFRGQPSEHDHGFETNDPCSTHTELTVQRSINVNDKVDFSKEANYHAGQPDNEESQLLTSTLEVDQINSLSPEVSCQDEALYQSKHQPIKLLSNRKVLSPTTQEKLCKAVDSFELIKPPRNATKLCFEQNSKDSPMKVSSVLELCGQSNDSAGPTKGILKSVNVPRRKHTQEAVIFSQRQMHDIESLATKLVNGLRSMKNVMEETLTLEASSSPLKVDADKMKAAINDAAELEETAKKWLFMMGKDCNRFCKILQRSAQHRTNHGIRKDQKKITFADEAGGTLCQVKIFQEPSC